MKNYIILIPLYNDWKSVSVLLKNIDQQTKDWDAALSILIVNDASTEKISGLDLNYKKIKSVKILNMKENRVHQRCIATGLKYICEKEDFDHIIIMDADGEDRPEELNDFFKKAKENPNKTITGNRFRRSEGFVFTVLYELHKLLTLIFTGKMIKFGNFTCLPKEHAQELIKKSSLWNSYSSSVVKTIKNRTSISSTRGYRYARPSKMKFTSLIFHSLTIISVFRNQVIIRSIIISLIYFFLIFNTFSIFAISPILLLLVFVLSILQISMRSNINELNKSLDNIESINVLGDSNNRQ